MDHSAEQPGAQQPGVRLPVDCHPEQTLILGSLRAHCKYLELEGRHESLFLKGSRMPRMRDYNDPKPLKKHRYPPSTPSYGNVVFLRVREHSGPDSSTLSQSPWLMMVLSQHRHARFLLHTAKGSASGETQVPGPRRTAEASPPLPSPSYQGPCE